MESSNGLTRVEVVPAPQQQAVEGAITEALSHYGTLVEFVKGVLQRDVDFGVIPGTKRPTLLKPGAEKLCKLFGLRPVPELVRCIEDFERPLFHYHYRVALLNRQGEIVAAGEGNCNSMEGKYQKQQSRIFDLPNTICKMAQKRAMVAAVLVATGASEFFTQDLEDWENVIDGGDRTPRQPARPQPQRQPALEEWQQWKSPDEAIAWGCRQLQPAGYSEYAVRAEFECLRQSTPGKVAAIWFAHVLRLLPPE